MAGAGLQAPAVPAPQAPQALQQPAQQAQHVPQLNWSHFKPEFQESQKKMQKHPYSEQMIGWTHINFRKVSKSKDFVSH